MENKNENLVSKIATGIAISMGTTLLSNLIALIKAYKSSSIDVDEYNSGYENMNKLLYKLDTKKYSKNRRPTTNKEYYELSNDILYFIKLKNNNYIKVSTYKQNTQLYTYSHLKLEFTGKDKYNYRNKFIKECLKQSDKDHILVKYLNKDDTMSLNIISHSFDNIILNSEVKNRIINGLKNWNNREDWYKNHQLVHKIGILLYGEAGTGKSTIARCVSTMFNNAPIINVNQNNVMKSIDLIIGTRKRIEGKMIVLIEDFDMCFVDRNESNSENKGKIIENQNAIFQLLDGVYSTDNTIYIATTNYKDKLDTALVRYGRFDIQEELKYFTKSQAEEFINLMNVDRKVLDTLKLEYPVEPSLLQSKIMEYLSKYC